MGSAASHLARALSTGATVSTWQRGGTRLPIDWDSGYVAQRSAANGLGDSLATAGAITQAAIGSVAKVASTSIASALGMGAAMIPLIGAGVAALTFAVPMILNQFRGCGQTCTAATRIVDQAGEALELNLRAYMEGPHTVTSQRVALDTFDQIWAAVANACSNPALGDAGRRCISERQRGGHVPGVTREGSWFEWYRDPIANDPNVKPDPVDPSSLQGIGTNFLAGMGSGTTLLLGAAALGVLALAMSD